MLERITPLLWLLFSAGGTVAALLFPIHVLLTGLAFPLGWLEPPSYEVAHRLLTHPVTRLYLFVLISFPLFPWLIASGTRSTMGCSSSISPRSSPSCAMAPPFWGRP